MIEIGFGIKRKIDDIIFSRYACYLIVMKGNPKKEVIAVSRTYFVVKTRRQLIIDTFDILTEVQRSLAIRNEIFGRVLFVIGTVIGIVGIVIGIIV